MQIRPPAMTEDSVISVEFFQNDIDNIDEEKAKIDELYSDVYRIFKDATAGEYITKSIRDIAELSRTMVQARSLAMDAVVKRHSIKKNVSDMVSKRKGLDGNEDAASQVARAIVREISKSGDLGIKTYKNANKENSKNKVNEEKKLEEIVNKKIKSSEIKLSKNDKLISVANHVQIQYSRKKSKFVAIDSRNGSIIKNFPEERLPDTTISRFSAVAVYTSTGEIYPLLKE